MIYGRCSIEPETKKLFERKFQKRCATLTITTENNNQLDENPNLFVHPFSPFRHSSRCDLARHFRVCEIQPTEINVHDFCDKKKRITVKLRG